jgi:hypothetical protein
MGYLDDSKDPNAGKEKIRLALAHDKLLKTLAISNVGPRDSRAILKIAG